MEPTTAREIIFSTSHVDLTLLLSTCSGTELGTLAVPAKVAIGLVTPGQFVIVIGRKGEIIPLSILLLNRGFRATADWKTLTWKAPYISGDIINYIIAGQVPVEGPVKVCLTFKTAAQFWSFLYFTVWPLSFVTNTPTTHSDPHLRSLAITYGWERLIDTFRTWDVERPAISERDHASSLVATTAGGEPSTDKASEGRLAEEVNVVISEEA